MTDGVPLGNKVGQASFIQGRSDSSTHFSTHTHRQSPSTCSTETKCPRSSLVVNLFVLHLSIVLITARGDPLHIHTLSRDNHTTDNGTWGLSSLSGGGRDCITFRLFFYRDYHCVLFSFFDYRYYYFSGRASPHTLNQTVV